MNDPIADLSKLTQKVRVVSVEHCHFEVMLDHSTGRAALQITENTPHPGQPILLQFATPMGVMLFFQALMAFGTPPPHPMARSNPTPNKHS